MKKYLPLLYMLAGVALLLIPTALYAAGLVPCLGVYDCDLCDLGRLAQNIINYLIVFVVFPLAAIMFAYSGFLYVTGSSNPTKIARARKIFKDVFIGFLIAISAWLIVNTVINVIFAKDFFPTGNWFVLECVEDHTNTPGRPGRLIGTHINDIFKDFVPDVKAPKFVPIVSTTIVDYNSEGEPVTCLSGYTYDQKNKTCFKPGTNGEGGHVTDPIPVNPNITPGPFPPPVEGPIIAGDCRSNPIFGARASLMSCICSAESGGVSRPSTTDVLNYDRRPFSFGLYQVNITVNPIRCPGQPVLNCPAAFTGRNYSARVINEALYATCRNAALRPDCSANTANYLLNHGGPGHWSVYLNGQCR